MEILKEIKREEYTVKAYIDNNSSEMWITPDEMIGNYIEVDSCGDFWGTDNYSEKFARSIITNNRYECVFIVSDDDYSIIDKHTSRVSVSDNSIVAMVYANKSDLGEGTKAEVLSAAKTLINYYNEELYRINISIEKDCIEVKGIFTNEKDISLDKLTKSIVPVEICCMSIVSIEFKSDDIVDEVVSDLEIDFNSCELMDFTCIKDMVEDVVEHVCKYVRE